MSSNDGLYAFVNKASKNLFHLVFQLFPLSKNSKEYEKLTRDWVKASYKPNHDKSFVWRQFCNFPNWKLSYNLLYMYVVFSTLFSTHFFVQWHKKTWLCTIRKLVKFMTFCLNYSHLSKESSYMFIFFGNFCPDYTIVRSYTFIKTLKISNE